MSTTSSASSPEDQPDQTIEDIPLAADDQKVQQGYIDKNQVAIKCLKGSPLCWYQVNVLCYDIRHFNVTTESHKRINTSAKYLSGCQYEHLQALRVPSSIPNNVLLSSPCGSSSIEGDRINTLAQLIDYLRDMSNAAAADRWRDIFFKDLAPFFEYMIGIFDGGRQLENRLWFLELMLKYGLQPPVEELAQWDDKMKGVYGTEEAQTTTEVASLWRNGTFEGMKPVEEWIKAINRE